MSEMRTTNGICNDSSRYVYMTNFNCVQIMVFLSPLALVFHSVCWHRSFSFYFVPFRSIRMFFDLFLFAFIAITMHTYICILYIIVTPNLIFRLNASLCVLSTGCWVRSWIIMLYCNTWKEIQIHMYETLVYTVYTEQEQEQNYKL